MSELIGNKTEFAVEYHILKEEPFVIGNIRLWIGGKYVGYFDSPTMLGVAVQSLIGVVERYGKFTIPGSLNMTAHEISKKIDSGELSDIHKLTITETFDDFLIDIYENNSSLVFNWKLTEDSCLEYPDYDHELNTFSVQKKIFKDITYKFKNSIEKIQKKQ